MNPAPCISLTPTMIKNFITSMAGVIGAKIFLVELLTKKLGVVE